MFKSKRVKELEQEVAMLNAKLDKIWDVANFGEEDGVKKNPYEWSRPCERVLKLREENEELKLELRKAENRFAYSRLQKAEEIIKELIKGMDSCDDESDESCENTYNTYIKAKNFIGGKE